MKSTTLDAIRAILAGDPVQTEADRNGLLAAVGLAPITAQPADPGDRRLLTQAEAADALGVSRMTVFRMIRDGRLPAVEIRAGRYRVPSAALSALVKGGAA